MKVKNKNCKKSSSKQKVEKYPDGVSGLDISQGMGVAGGLLGLATQGNRNSKFAKIGSIGMNLASVGTGFAGGFKTPTGASAFPRYRDAERVR